MNVLGSIDEIHKETDIKYGINLQFEKLIIKIDK